MTTKAVRRPIGVKIFSIAVVLIALMICATWVSSLSLRRMGQELEFLARYSVVLDQKIADVRAYGLYELILIERLLQHHPARSFKEARDAAAKLQDGECTPEATRTAIARIKEDFRNPGDRHLVLYELMKRCAADKLARMESLVSQAIALDVVQRNPSKLEFLTDFRHSLRDIPAAQAELNGEFEKFLGEADRSKPAVAAVLREDLEQSRTAVSRQIGAAVNAIHLAARETATDVLETERRVQWIGWGITGSACLLGLLIAALLTRNLVRPVHDLLVGTKQVEGGDLDVEIKVNTADELAQLADSFNRMVQDLRQKAAIKETFGKYVDPRVVEGILGRDDFRLGGDRRLMTIFFSDLAGFTSMSETLTPSNVVKLLNEYFTYVCEPIRTHHGVVDKYIGDAVMAFWGPPFSPETAFAALACEAALEQRKRLVAFQSRLPEILGLRKGIPMLRVRMGIATGDVTVGSIGSDSARSYTVIGDTVNLASRLEGLNKMYGTDIVIDEATFLAAKDAIDARELDLVRVMGRNEPVRIYELLGPKGSSSEETAAACATFARALELYRRKEWREAEAGFAECLAHNAGDGPARTFLERCRTFAAAAVPAGWDGTWTASSK